MKTKTKVLLYCLFTSLILLVSSISIYISFPPKYAKRDTSKNLIIIGGCNEIFIPELERGIKPTLKEEAYSFFQWYQYRAICKYLESNNNKIVLIGHSYGGATAAEIASKYKNRVSLLVTLDPVSWKRNYDLTGLKWLNIIANEKKGSWNGLIATIGGKWGEQKEATNYRLPCNHANAKAMLFAETEKHVTIWDEIISNIDKNMLNPYPDIFNLSVSELSEYFIENQGSIKEYRNYFFSMGNAAFLYYFPCFLSYFQSDASSGDIDTLICFIDIIERRQKYFPHIFLEIQDLTLNTLDYSLENLSKFNPVNEIELRERIKTIRDNMLNNSNITN